MSVVISPRVVFSYGGYSIRSVGLVGFILYAFYFFFLIRRTYLIMGDNEMLKVVFHFVLLANSVLEALYFLMMLLFNE